MPTFCSVLSLFCSTAYQALLLRSTLSFLHLVNVSLKYRYVYFHCSILLYIFVVFQVEDVWCLLSTTCTVKLRNPLVLLWFHCQWNHRNCMASIPTHCPFNTCVITQVIKSRQSQRVLWISVIPSVSRRKNVTRIHFYPGLVLEFSMRYTYKICRVIRRDNFVEKITYLMSTGLLGTWLFHKKTYRTTHWRRIYQ